MWEKPVPKQGQEPMSRHAWIDVGHAGDQVGAEHTGAGGSGAHGSRAHK